MTAKKAEKGDYSYIPLENLLSKVSGMYKLVILASRRAVELNQGSNKLVDITAKAKCSTVALEEIKDGKVFYKISDKDDKEAKKKAS